MDNFEKNILTLSKYLITKEINSALKIQKILFFMRVEELKNKKTESTYFKEDKNFQAWIYGPVNPESYFFIQKFFNEKDEKENFLLDDEQVKEIDQLYLKSFEKYYKCSSNQLIKISHENTAWIEARGNLGSDEICKKFMIENDDFINFKNAL